MAGENDEKVGAVVAADSRTMAKEVAKTKKKGLISRVWNELFGSREDDFERRLERNCKEEATVLTRMTRRAQNLGSIIIILFAVLLEVYYSVVGVFLLAI